MSFESLANELLLDLFEYFPVVDLLRAFHRLNTRIDNLIISHFQTHTLDFQNISKQDFDIICQVNLSVIIKHVVSLRLSDDNETPQQIELFRSYQWDFNQFESLRYLTLNQIRSLPMTTEILSRCLQLIHLNLTALYSQHQDDDFLRFMNNIWNLPKLTRCYLNVKLTHQSNIPTPTVYSMSIEHLSLIDVSYHTGQLLHLYEHTPNLRYLEISLYHMNYVEKLRRTIPSVTTLYLVSLNPQDGILKSVLQYMPNLYRLKVEIVYLPVNGYQWEQIIESYLPKLKIFQLKMTFQMIDIRFKEDLFTSFQTSFWLEKHQWFIRYHDNSNQICLYTLPYSFSDLTIYSPFHTKYTCPNDIFYQSYNCVQRLLSLSCSLRAIMHLSYLQFPNIITLTIKFPYNEYLIPVVKEFRRLHSLEISRRHNTLDADVQSQLQLLLDHTTDLYSLKFDSWSEIKQSTTSEKLTPMIIKSQSIRQLNLLGFCHCFTHEECLDFSRSSIAIHCEVLCIRVEQRKSILYLINTMDTLRALVVRSVDDSWTCFQKDENELDRWLKQNLSSECSIQRDSRSMRLIRIWIHR